MKTAVFMRHGHAAEGKDDHARVLTAEGRAAVEASARELLAAGLLPDLVITSTAERARVTAELSKRVLGSEAPLVERRELYLAEPERYLATIRALGSDVDTVLLVAHNPGLEALAEQLGGPARLSPARYFTVRRDVATWQEFGP
jgi:phosphohistidine phosphatase